jgi:hypothetical protein
LCLKSYSNSRWKNNIALYVIWVITIKNRKAAITANAGGRKIFDEKSGRWIRIYKILTIITFGICIAFGILAGIGDASASFLGVDIG